MAATILQLQAKVTADTKDAESGLRNIKDRAEEASGDSGGGGIKGLLGHMLSIAGGAAIFAGVAGGVSFLADQVKDSIQAAQNYQLVQAQTNAVLRSTGDASGFTAQQIGDLAEHLSTITPFSRDVTQSAENMLLTFTNIKGNLPQVTQTTLDFATAMHMDATNAALQLGKALNDPATGYTKLQREGVTFTKSQIETIKSMEASGNMAGAQAVILQELQKEFGGSATAAGSTFAGSLQILQNQLEDTKEQVGAALIPVLSQLLTALAPVMAGFAQFVSGALSGLASFLQGTLIPTFQQWMPVLGAVLSGAQHLGDVFMTALKPALDQLGHAFDGAKGPGLNVKDALAGIQDVVNHVAPVVGQLGQAFGQLAVWFVTNVLPAAQRLAGYFITNILPVLGQVAQFVITQVVPAVGQFAQFIITNVIPVIVQLVGWFAKNVIPVIEQLAQIFITDVLPALESVWQSVSKNLIPALENLWNKISPILIPVLQTLGWILKNVIGPAIGFVIVVLGDIINVIATVIGWIGHIGDAFNGLGTLVSNIAGGIGIAFKAGLDGVIGAINSFISFLDGIQIHVPAIGVGPVKTPAFDWNGLGIPQIPLLAAGGDVGPGGQAIVGDAGPELLSVGRGGARVTPLPSGLGGTGAGGGQIVIHLHNYMDGRKVAEIVTKHQPSVIRNATGQRSF